MPFRYNLLALRKILVPVKKHWQDDQNIRAMASKNSKHEAITVLKKMDVLLKQSTTLYEAETVTIVTGCRECPLLCNM